MKNITEPSATEWLGRLKNGDVSSVELVNQTIARISEGWRHGWIICLCRQGVMMNFTLLLSNGSYK